MCKNVSCLEYIYLQAERKVAHKKKLKFMCKKEESQEYIYMKPINNKTMAKTIYTIALGFNYRQRKAVLKFNGYNFVRQGKGDHELWSNGVVDIVIMQNDKGCSFVDFCRKNKIVFTDEKGRKVY